MMWKYIYAAFLMIAFTACHTNKTLEKSDKPASKANYTLPEHLSVSASFRMFWVAWNADLRQSGNNLEKYIPSELLIKRFSLHNQNGNYRVDPSSKCTPASLSRSCKGPNRTFPGQPSQRCLCHNHCIAKGDRQQNVNQQKNSTAIFCRQVWEQPDIAQDNRGAGCRQDKAKFAGK